MYVFPLLLDTKFHTHTKQESELKESKCKEFEAANVGLGAGRLVIYICEICDQL
jgi:hypothetical protein